MKDSQTPLAEVSEDAPPRRTFLTSVATIALAVAAFAVPVISGIVMFLDPVFRRRATGGGDSGKRKFVRISTLDALPPDGTPVQFAIMEDRVDAWNREPNQPVGSIFLRRLGEQALAFNAVCPHAGCYVAYAAAKNAFRCPCHNSSFALDGAKLESGGMVNPSPRPLDKLDVELRNAFTQEPVEPKDVGKLKVPVDVWVRFVNFQAGTSERLAKR